MSGDDVELMVRHRTTEIEGVKIFYREGGSPSAPAVLLLHGFPSSSFQFRYMLPVLADTYHVLAPDFPAFGFSECPVRSRYSYKFDHYADTIEAFTNKLGLAQYALYVHDYGAQVGFRLALRSPERVAALVIQNSEASEDGRTQSWSAIEDYWRDPSLLKREALRQRLFTEKGIRSEFVEHLPPEIVELIDPSTIALSWTHIRRPGVVEALLDLHLDYQSNVVLYPRFQSYFRAHRPPAAHQQRLPRTSAICQTPRSTSLMVVIGHLKATDRGSFNSRVSSSIGIAARVLPTCGLRNASSSSDSQRRQS